jgi:small-conductance mechanosensitive channel
VLILSVISLLSGYIVFALFLTRFMVWTAVVASALYLLLMRWMTSATPSSIARGGWPTPSRRGSASAAA